MRATGMGVKVRFHRGAWWVFVDHHGKRRSKKVGDRDTALAVARKLRERLAEGDLSVFGTERSEPFRAYAERWLTHGEASRKASTHRFYAFNLSLHVLPVLGDHPIAKLKRSDCRDLLLACRAKGLKPASLRGVNRTLSAVLSQAVDDELLPANPAFRMGKHLREGDERPAEIQPLTREEAHTLLVTAEKVCPEFYPLFLCALRTGLRLGEVIALQWGDVDVTGRFLDVRRNRVAGRLTTTKNRLRRRVDLSRVLTETLRKLRTQRKAAALKAGTPLEPWVFLTSAGVPVDPDNLRKRVFYRLLEHAGLRAVRFHDLRHTYASHLIQQGESLAYVCRQLGHSSIQVTVDVYGHLIPGTNQTAVDKLDALPVRIPGASEDDEIGTGDSRK